MPYFIPHFTSVPQYAPQFDPVNEDGSRFEYQKDIAHTDGLATGEKVTDASDLRPSSVYRFAECVSAHKDLPDLFRAGQEICINERMRDIIETLEPDKHQLFPIVLRKKNKQPYPGHFWLLNICQLFDTLIFEQSNLRVAATPRGLKYVTRGLSMQDFRTLRPGASEGHHLWREKSYIYDIYISDAMYSRMQADKIKSVQSRNYIKTIALADGH